ncbi:MAG: hypothetical protein KDM81_07770 [Verrucomicrobiae bacterium]|nr:hypothetical protein [Verrucomicrobiae bacterium]
MPSSLTWVDHDAAARERTTRILALLQEKESRDELGLGAIRDSFAGQFFPGTSTIQTRLRYMLFVAWIYHGLEQREVSPAEFARRADQAERDLIDAMSNADDREAGIFGGRSGKNLKRLPSSVYWAGLGAWGIRRFDLSRDQYHRSIGSFYAKRRADRQHRHERRDVGDDNDGHTSGVVTWHPRLPPKPDDFPRNASFSLTIDEAEFLRDCIQKNHPRSLLAHLARNIRPAKVSAPWEHPDYGSFTDDHKELLTHARLFSATMHSAALVYNIGLADEREWKQKQDEHRVSLAEWRDHMDLAEVREWSLARLWALTEGQGHRITRKTQRFVEEWIAILGSSGKHIGENPAARRLVRLREMDLKRGRSRFRNQRALENWGGSSGLVRMTYRWPNASRFLDDLGDGLGIGGLADA